METLERLTGSEGTSVEAAARRILCMAVQTRTHRPGSVPALVRRLYAGASPKDVVDDFLAQRRRDAPEE